MLRALIVSVLMLALAGRAEAAAVLGETGTLGCEDSTAAPRPEYR
jgi:hypothetical protein